MAFDTVTVVPVPPLFCAGGGPPIPLWEEGEGEHAVAATARVLIATRHSRRLTNGESVSKNCGAAGRAMLLSAHGCVFCLVVRKKRSPAILFCREDIQYLVSCILRIS
jgi:hypothetical protein